MENQQTTPIISETEPVIPTTQAPMVTPQPLSTAPVTPSTPHTKEKKQLPIIPLLAGLIALLLIAVLVMFIQGRRANAPTAQIVMIPTAAPTPTPIRKPSVLSGTEAFASFSAQKASFSAEINTFTFQEGIFTPPTLDLDLGIND